MLSGGTKDALAASLVLEPLARFGPDGVMVPALAEFIPAAGNGISDDLTQITWTLKSDVVWNDGTPFTADDVVFTYEYCSDEATGCSLDLTTVASVVADDDSHVTITFNEPKPFPYDQFVGYLAPIIQRAQFQDCVGAAAGSCTDQNFAPVGTGPYMVTELRPEDTVTYEFNPMWRGNAQGEPYFGNVTIKGGGDAEAAARSVLEIGEADYAWNLQVAPEILGPMEAAGNGEVVVSFTANVEHINLNQTDNRAEGDLQSNWDGGNNPNPFFANNPEFARALSIAINRDELVIVGYGATGIPTCNIWNVGAGTSTNNDWCLTQDIDEANNILDGLGYLDTDDDGVRELPDGTPLEFDYVTSTNAVRQSNQDLIKGYWEEIGVVANMKNEDASCSSMAPAAATPVSGSSSATSRCSPTVRRSLIHASYLGHGLDLPTRFRRQRAAWGGQATCLASQTRNWTRPGQSSTLQSIDDPAPQRPRYSSERPHLGGERRRDSADQPRFGVGETPTRLKTAGALNGWDSEYWNIHEWTRE